MKLALATPMIHIEKSKNFDTFIGGEIGLTLRFYHSLQLAKTEEKKIMPNYVYKVCIHLVPRTDNPVLNTTHFSCPLDGEDVTEKWLKSYWHLVSYLPTVRI